MVEPLRILNLQAENFKRLVAVDITPDSDVVHIVGKNAQGKTSVLDAIWAALAGADASRSGVTTLPIRDGERRARVRLDLGDYIVTRKWAASGPSTLTVESPRGAKYSSPQALLDSLIGRYAFDPLAFTRQSGRDQVSTLVNVLGDSLGFDPVALDAERKRLYDERTAANREVERTKTTRDALGPLPDGIPEADVSVVDLLDELATVDGHNRDIDAMFDEAARLQTARERAEDDVLRLENELGNARLVFSEAKSAEEAQLAEYRKTERLERQPVLDRIARVEEVNAGVRLRKQIEDAEEDFAHAALTAAELDGHISDIDQRKREGLAAAKFPVDGLSFDEDGVTYNGIPFGQASTSEQLRVSVALAMAMNPTLRVLRIDRAEALDSDGLATIRELADKNDYQVWLSRVDESGAIGVVIEEGTVKK